MWLLQYLRINDFILVLSDNNIQSDATNTRITTQCTFANLVFSHFKHYKPSGLGDDDFLRDALLDMQFKVKTLKSI